ncbi:hypothetical protein [Dyadobacter sp. OTU695]|uniref:hypothetical protein n=1 Tax=Dyadobacter sp. OTU695 TaxID=3043860 RepID=UPI00313C2284
MVHTYLQNEATSMLSRLGQLQPFSLSTPMVAAASPSDEALRAVTDHLINTKRELRAKVNSFLAKLKTQGADGFATASEAQASYAILKLRFNNILDQQDIFADVITQRTEHQTGVWIAGLDVVAADALQPRKGLYETTPMMCFLERGHGAAIRRARTRLPGGDLNPLAIIQVPRERMVGSGIASSLIHEVGHQGAALLSLVESLRETLMKRIGLAPQPEKLAWMLYERWISEIVADFWAMGHLGITATQGLMGVVSLPEYFMFRVKLDDPHPFPWIRVKLSLAVGALLFPDRQWQKFEQLWQQIYPIVKLDEEKRSIIAQLDAVMPAFTELLIGHRSNALQNFTLGGLFPLEARQPERLRELYSQLMSRPETAIKAPPSLVFAIIGQARADGRITAAREGHLLSRFLNHWAMSRAESRGSNQKSIILNHFNNGKEISKQAG